MVVTAEKREFLFRALKDHMIRKRRPAGREQLTARPVTRAAHGRSRVARIRAYGTSAPVPDSLLRHMPASRAAPHGCTPRRARGAFDINTDGNIFLIGISLGNYISHLDAGRARAISSPNAANMAVAKTPTAAAAANTSSLDSPTGVEELDAKAPKSIDHFLGEQFFLLCKRNALCKAIFDASSVSGDEIIWFLPAAAFITGGFALRGAAAVARGGRIARASCPEEVGCDMFAVCSVCSTLEMAIKLFFERPRPPYVRRDVQTYVLPGECWSFPSGHSMRAACFAFWLVFGKNGGLLCAFFRVPRPPLAAALAWAASVAAARVAKGRHYPSDAAVGYLLGIAVGGCMEGARLTQLQRGVVKVGGGVVVTGSWGAFFLTPLLSRATGVPAAVLYPLYLMFYVAMLVASVPRTTEGWDFGACKSYYP